MALVGEGEWFLALERLLRSSGFHVESIPPSSLAGRDLHCDVVLLELAPPKSDAASVTRARTALGDDVDIVCLATGPTVPVVVEAIRAGAEDVLAHSASPAEIVAAIGRSIARGRVARENLALRRLAASPAPMPLDHHGPLMRQVLAEAALVGEMDVPVLVEGESGVGKEIVARRLHDHSPRSGGPWIPVSSAALGSDVVDSELFGHEKGAFTGAAERHLGLVEVASEGTLLLDEVGLVPLATQGRLLRFVELGEYRRVGGTEALVSGARIIASTNRNLEAEAREGRFRPELLQRLAVVHLRVPPLRERKEEIPAFISHFLTQRRVPSRALPTEVLRALTEYDWPGNVRELKGLMGRLLLEGPLERATVKQVTALLQRADPVEDLTLERIERDHIRSALELHGWNRTKAAAALGVSVRTLYSKIRSYGLAKVRRPA